MTDLNRDFLTADEEEKRLDIMIEYCKRTGESLDKVEKKTRGMTPQEVEFWTKRAPVVFAKAEA